MRPDLQSAQRRARCDQQVAHPARDFTVASTKELTGRMLAIRNGAFSALGDTGLYATPVQGPGNVGTAEFECDIPPTATPSIPARAVL